MGPVPPEKINTAYFLRIACGQLGLKAHEFYAYRAAHFFEHLRGYNDARKAEQQFNFLMLRYQTVKLVNIQLEQSKQYTDLEEFWPSPWKDEEAEMLPENIQQEIDSKLSAALDAHLKAKKENAPAGTPKTE